MPFSNINKIDFEFHSKCNRKCEWCPNSFIDRQSQDIILNKQLFIKTVQELYDNNFGVQEYYKNGLYSKAMITFLGYQEPLIQTEILKEYILIIKNIFKDREIIISTNSNGDFFSEEILQNLYLSSLNIMDYDCKGSEYWEKKLKNAKCLITYKDNQIIQATHRYINFIQITLNWPKTQLLEDRGGSLNPKDLDASVKWKNNCELRKYPCNIVNQQISISYTGEVMPCCHLRFDNLNHIQYSWGNLNNNTLKEIFYGKKATTFKTLISSSNYNNFISTCQHCQKN